MNELTKNIQKMMVPKAAIIAYKYEDRRNFDTRYFIELRPIGKNGQMGAGIPVTYEFMNTLLESYTEEMSGIPAGRVPENMLACNPRKGQEEYIWYNPPGKRQMFFHFRALSMKKLESLMLLKSLMNILIWKAENLY